jgi:6-phosphogluconolactonase (cycloisomerase 2 family)
LQEENPSKTHQKQKMAHCHKLLEITPSNRLLCHSVGGFENIAPLKNHSATIALSLVYLLSA